ncbi:hypothetical protein J1N35_006293 [Gossypium stocksii]|uniref:Uncharacterized protein n=1 Tax=Gossypium stocksii TaxID=47602 RepID=A0A9D3WG15_9ROSI|nr:hypothetical protein J1N35_006293 [Gossypium stocksii]
MRVFRRINPGEAGWENAIKKSREGLKRKLTKKLECLMAGERDADTLEKIIDTRINLNMEIDKDEMYWEQRARANWLRLGDKNLAFFHNFASVCRRINTINRRESDNGQEISGAGEIR